MRSISVAGLTPFLVTLEPTPANLARFVEAMTRTNARVAQSARTEPRRWRVWVWIRPAYIGLFETICDPVGFTFIPAEEIGLDTGPQVPRR